MLAASCHVRLPLASFSRKRRSGGRECRFGGRDRVDAAGKATLSAGDDGAVTGVEPVNEIEACALKADARALEVGGGRPEAARRRWHLGREGATTRPERVERSNDAIAQFRGATVEQRRRSPRSFSSSPAVFAASRAVSAHRSARIAHCSSSDFPIVSISMSAALVVLSMSAGLDSSDPPHPASTSAAMRPASPAMAGVCGTVSG